MILGLDIGGSFIRAGLVDKKRVAKRALVPTGRGPKEAIVSNIFSAISQVYNKKIKKIGIGFPAPVYNGKIFAVNNIPELSNFNLKKAIEKKFKVKCFIENDANAFTLAESIYGSAKSYKTVVGITLGTGLGCGIVLNKKIYSGNTGAAGEINKIKINGKTLEDLASKKFFYEDPRELFDTAKRKDERAKDIFREYGRNVGFVLSIIANVLDPEIIIIGGQISKAYEFFEKPMLEELEKNTSEQTFKNLKIKKSRLRDAGILGAALLCE